MSADQGAQLPDDCTAANHAISIIEHAILLVIGATNAVSHAKTHRRDILD
ncbi:hypothetical protein BofuT4_uP122690.1 [Botrytis cinerea T4]|uniref:Uncharacterized protein n=1 Tax=Botryotinia fuckeliana (strain T4) TaxID=999810 RepID=G2YNQ2_BOTF4|nr:hypothetical protein BofuT4_uP122690.1 [Botrytis cinerea T4]